jgi:hypothetical protein
MTINQRHIAHLQTEHFGTLHVVENDAAPFTGGTNVDDHGDPIPAEPELVIFTDFVLSDPEPNLLRHIRVVDGHGRTWELDLRDGQ